MRYVLMVLLIVLSLNAEEKQQKITIGAGPFIQTQPYENVDNIVIASPVIFFDNGIAYIRWSRAGIYFLGKHEEDYAWGFSLTIQPRVYGYSASDIEGMHERKNTWEGGLAFSAKRDNAYIEIMLLTDILDRYGDWLVKTEAGYDVTLGDFSLYPSLIVVYQSSAFLNYYYGVRKDEALGYRKEYIPGDGVQIGAQTYIKYPLTESLATLVNLRIDRIANEATKSPIVEKDYIYSGLLSLIYTFEF